MKNITNMNYLQKTPMSYIIYKILVEKHQYSIYTIYIIYIYIFLYPLKYIKAAAIGQSEELFCPILNCLNILQPYSEDTEIKRREREEKNKYKANKLKLFTKHPMNLCVVWNSAEPKEKQKTQQQQQQKKHSSRNRCLF